MQKRVFSLLLTLSLLLTGCGWLEGSYVSVTAHREQRQTGQNDVVSASDYLQLLEALEGMIAGGTELMAIIVADYPEEQLEHGIQRAVEHTLKNDPLGSYAAEDIRYELGTSNGVPALSVSITYRHNRSEIQRIQRVADMDLAERAAANALEGYDPVLVLLIDKYIRKDFIQFVQDYAQANPNTVMEIPQVTETIYGTGRDRVVELVFTYQNSRDILRRMQNQVQPVFSAASLYVSGDGEEHQKFSQLYAFLMERFDYKLETSITPAYSLLRHGVGDSRAFATVYAYMCRSAGLTCMTVTGTRAGEPWTWNMVLDGGRYFHVDLLHSSEWGDYAEHTDSEMEGYVWDYSSYPVCNGSVIPAETVPEEKIEKSEN